VDPDDGLAEVQLRSYGFDLSGRSYITVRGLTVFGASINMDDADHCIIDKCRALNICPFFHSGGWNRQGISYGSAGKGIVMGGSNNEVSNSEIAHSWGDGVTIYGSGNTVNNCLIYDCNWSATDCALIAMSYSDHAITRNTMYNCGRTGIVHRIAESCEIGYNDLWQFCRQKGDAGATYCWQTDGGGTVIHHNWVHDPATPLYGTWHNDGIYLDDGSTNFVIHHNVVWNCDYNIRLGHIHPSFNQEVYNNTLVGSGMAEHGSNTFNNIRVYNNLVHGNLVGTDFQSNIEISDGSMFVDPDQHNYALKSGAEAIDAGVVISGYTDGYAGSAPDVGAYEYEGEYWTAGANMDQLTAIGMAPSVHAPPRFVDFARDRLTVNPSAGELLINVYKANGMLFKTIHVHKQDNKDLSLREFPTGLYVFRIRAVKDGRTQNTLFSRH
jgi:hypothetical protein